MKEHFFKIIDWFIFHLLPGDLSLLKEKNMSVLQNLSSIQYPLPPWMSCHTFFPINQWSVRCPSFNQRKCYYSAGKSACNMPKGVCLNFNGWSVESKFHKSTEKMYLFIIRCEVKSSVSLLKTLITSRKSCKIIINTQNFRMLVIRKGKSGFVL